MFIDSVVVFFALSCMLGGALHVLAPDHWVPVSLLSWQRGWRMSRLAAFSFLVFVPHIFLGFFIYWLILDRIARVPASAFFLFSVVFIVSVALVRRFRFKRIHEVLRTGPQGFSALITAFSLLGPSESLIPFLLKARSLGMGYIIPSVAFLLGTLLSGIVLIVSGKIVWNRPYWFPRTIKWTDQGMWVVPVMAGVILSLVFL